MSYLEIANTIILVILSIAFFALNKRLSMIKAYADIFKVKDVKEYVEMKDELFRDKAVKMIMDSDELKAISLKATTEKTDEIAKYYGEIMGGRYIEMTRVLCGFIERFIVPEQHIEFIEKNLPENAHVFKPIFEEMHDNETEQP